MQHKFKAYVAGFGSGKTWVGCGGICKGMWELFIPLIDFDAQPPVKGHLFDRRIEDVTNLRVSWRDAAQIQSLRCWVRVR
jgi:hypothetical protein